MKNVLWFGYWLVLYEIKKNLENVGLTVENVAKERLTFKRVWIEKLILSKTFKDDTIL